MVTRSHARSIYRGAPAALAAVATSGSGRAAFSLRLVARSHARSIYRVSDLGGVPVDPAAVAAIQELSVVPAAAVAAIQEQSVAPAAAVAAIQEHSVALAAAVAAIQEQSAAPAAPVAAIQERYRGLEAAVAASGSAAGPVAAARDVPEAGSVARGRGR